MTNPDTTTDIAISARGLGKRYLRNGGPKHDSLRDMLQAWTA